MRIKLSNKIILFIILVVASVLRFYNYFAIPFTHDEFSAIFRTDFASFRELIKNGVQPDGHPAGIQVFLYYWVQLFGIAEWIIKLPFTIFGILSVYLVYLIGKRWFNESVGLFSAAFVASIQYTVMYSQIARPYISGLFFSLLMVHSLTKIIQSQDKKDYKESLIFIISASLCTYNHHFSMLFAVIAGISGLFFIKKDFLLRYVTMGAIIVILYLPHLNILMHQLQIGGVGGWLGKPTNDFILNYLFFLFNYSWIGLLLAASIMVYGIFKKSTEKSIYKKLLLFLSWFIIPYLIGFIYSKYVNSVLQFSVLIFSFPYLYFILFGHITPLNAKSNFIIVLVILSVNSLTLIFEREHYTHFFQSNFEYILKDYQKYNDNHQKVISIIDSRRDISDYYLSEHGIEPEFTWLDTFQNEYEFKCYLEDICDQHDFLYLGCRSSINSLIIPIIREFYPQIASQNNYIGGNSYLFSKNDMGSHGVISKADFNSPIKEHWTIDTALYVDSIGASDLSSLCIHPTVEWGPTYKNSLHNVIEHKNNFIDASIQIKAWDYPEGIILVTSLESNGKVLYWSGSSLTSFIGNDSSNKEWVTIHQSLKLSDIKATPPNTKLKVYVWNKGNRTFYMDNFEIRLREGNPIIYGLYQKF